MRPNKDRRTEIILYGLLLIPLLFTAAALAQATEQAQGLAEITAVLSEILHTPSMLRWCASTPKFLLAVLMLYPLAVYCYMLDQADRHPGAEHGTAKWGSAHRLNIKYRNTKDSKENYILTENVRFSTDSHAHHPNVKYTPDAGGEPYVMPPDYMGDAVTITMDAVAAATAPEITEEMYEQLNYLEKHPEENYYENEENFSQYDQGD